MKMRRHRYLWDIFRWFHFIPRCRLCFVLEFCVLIPILHFSQFSAQHSNHCYLRLNELDADFIIGFCEFVSYSFCPNCARVDFSLSKTGSNWKWKKNWIGVFTVGKIMLSRLEEFELAILCYCASHGRNYENALRGRIISMAKQWITVKPL